MHQRAVPVIRISAGSGSLDFYRRLGFEVEWEHRFEPDMPLFASIRRDGWQLLLSEHAGDATPQSLVYLYADDVDALHRAWRAAGVADRPPRDMAWGMRELHLVDPDGNRLRFGSPSHAARGSPRTGA
jgi:catechol 2,3-dioxygenase-like lactoylglutathione lyase family enzyme